MADAVKFVSEDVFTASFADSQQAEFNQPAYTRLECSGVLARFLREPEPLAAILYWLQHVACTQVRSANLVSAMLCRAIADIDRLINLQLNDIIHHNQLQQLEASWRGLLYLTEQTERHDREQKVKVKLLSLSWPELSKDINRAIDFDQSDFFKLIYDNEFDMPGGEPFGVLIGDYQISHKIRPGQLTNDLDTLKEVARTAAAAFLKNNWKSGSRVNASMVANSDGTTVDVHARWIDIEHLVHRAGLRSKGFVELEQVHVGRFPAGAGQRLL